jgi:endoglucanase
MRAASDISREHLGMTRTIFHSFLLLLPWALTACDAGSSSPKAPPPVVISETDDSWVRTGPTPVEAHGQLAVVGTDLVDQNGDQVQLKGVSSMWLNWETDGFAEDPAALVWMRDHWNLSVLRAAMGVDVGGAFLSNPDKAKTQVRTIVENAISAGVYVIVDWHDHNATLHQAQAEQFFAELAAEFADVPNIIYEPFNEPLKLDWETQLKPYHEAVVASIRAADPDNVIILGTPTWSQDVDVVARSPLDGANLMYTLHFYSCTHTSWLRTKAGTARSLGLPMFVTEWGATHADGGTDGKVCLDEASAWIDFMANAGIGWAAWKLDNCPQDSTCLLTADAPRNGGWTNEYLHGHAPFVRDALRL